MSEDENPSDAQVEKPRLTEELRQTEENEPVAPFQPNPQEPPTSTPENPPPPPERDPEKEAELTEQQGD